MSKEIIEKIEKNIESDFKKEIRETEFKIKKAIYELDSSLCKHSKDFGMEGYFDCFVEINIESWLKKHNKHDQLLNKRVSNFYEGIKNLLTCVDR